MSGVEVSLQLEKFIQLRQKDSTLREYISKFMDLALFWMSLINMPMKKAKKLMKDLNSPLREMLLTQILAGVTYKTIVEMASLQSASAEENEAEKKSGLTRKQKESKREAFRQTRRKRGNSRRMVKYAGDAIKRVMRLTIVG